MGSVVWTPASQFQLFDAQPQINRGCDLTQGLLALFSLGTGVAPFELVHGIPLLTNAAPTRASGPGWSGFTSTAAGASYTGFYVPQGALSLVRPVAPPATFFLVGAGSATSQVAGNISFGNGSSLTNFTGLGFYYGSLIQGAIGSVYCSSALSVASGASVDIRTGVHTAVLSIGPTTTTLYVDGGNAVTGTTPSGNFSYPAFTAYNSLDLCANGAGYGSTTYAAGVVGGYAWTAQQAAEFAARPAILFLPRTRRLYFGAAGGNVWNLSLVEAGAALDAPGASAAYVAALSESGSAQDVPGATVSYVAALVEVGSAQDSPGATAVYTVALAEAGSASDLENFGAAATSASVAETGAALDTITATVVFSAALSEAGAAADTVSAQANFAAALAESGNASDAPSATASFLASIVEAGAASDSETFGGAASSAALAEAGFAADTISAIVTFAASLVESGAATDAYAAVAALSAALVESGSAQDMPGATANMSVSIVEIGAALDVTSWSLPYTLATDPYFAVPTLTRSFTVRALGRTFIVTTLNRKFDA